jgi:hypothetical protein
MRLTFSLFIPKNLAIGTKDSSSMITRYDRFFDDSGSDAHNTAPGNDAGIIVVIVIQDLGGSHT